MAHLSLEKVSTDCHRDVLRRLMEFYLYDFSSFMECFPNERGSFEDAPPFSYISNPKVDSYLVQVEGRLAGFVMVLLHSRLSGDPRVRDLNQFFILRSYRRNGIGTQAAHMVLRLYPGCWEVRCLESNTAAKAFWERTILRVVGDEFNQELITREHGLEVVYRFQIAAGVER